MVAESCEITKRFYEREATRFRVKLAACLLLMDDAQVCLQRRCGTGIDDGLYTVPMGSVEMGEKAIDTLIREAKEEINIDIDAKNVRLGHAMYRRQLLPDGYVFYQQDLFFHVTHYSGELCNLEPHKADDVRFFAFDKMPTAIVPHIVQAINLTRKGEMYSEYGFTSQ